MSNPSRALPLKGDLGTEALLDALGLAAAHNVYCTIQISGATTSGTLHLANGAILVHGAADADTRQRSISAIIGLVHASLHDAGSFRIGPLTSVPSADAVPRIQVAAAVETARKSTRPSAPSPRIRASQLRRILREGGNISDYLPQQPTTQDRSSEAASRSNALKELIGQLAAD